MIYFSVYQAHYGMYVEELTEYEFWLAMYNSEMDFPYKIDMWQYTDSGTVPGINGLVDLNIFFQYE
jgi:GH25 family lysozyme M1 (1,4-beta-N-acetylmuramidase)